ncbi:MAG: hypothetical protein KAG93_06345 [Desulfuromusa sp.]|nr:hypothetical protein [Desulfuromusa sp.]
MLRLFKYFLWVVVIVALSVGFDQLMLRVPLHAPGLNQTQQFYVDFRTRLLGLFRTKTKSPPDVIEAVIKKATALSVPATKKPSRYLYVDGNGILQFADSLQQVPRQYRQEAQPIAE